MPIARATLEIRLRERGSADPRTAPVLRDIDIDGSLGLQQTRESAALVDVTRLRDGLGIAARRRVGVTEFAVRSRLGTRARLRVVVEPGSPHISIGEAVAMLAFDPRAGDFGSAEASADTGDDFVELICATFVREVERLLRRGIRRDFVREGSVLARPRGRINPRSYAVSYLTDQPRFACTMTSHTFDNDYNRVIVRALRGVVATSRRVSLRRRAWTLAKTIPAVPSGNAILPRLSYRGQFSAYRTTHRLAGVLLQGGGVDPGTFGSVQSTSFSMDVAFAFQSFLTSVLSHLLGESMYVKTAREYVFEDGRGQLLTSQGYVIPDIQLVSRATGRVVALLDAKCEAEFPDVAAGDYYQGYVYSDLFSRRQPGSLIPVALCGPASATTLVGIRRAAAAIDCRGHRPLIATIGVHVGGVLSRDAARRRAALDQLSGALQQLTSLSAMPAPAPIAEVV